MSAFMRGDRVTPKLSVQGLHAGREYVVQEVIEQSLIFGTFVTYIVEDLKQPGQRIQVANGQLLLQALVNQDRVLVSQLIAHREAVKAASAAVTRWWRENEEDRTDVALGMLELIGECTTDPDGDQTVAIVSVLLEEHAEHLGEDRASCRVAHAIAQMAVEAQILNKLLWPEMDECTICSNAYPVGRMENGICAECRERQVE
jgi:hypothetical protein